MNNSLFNGNLVKTNRIIYTPSEFAKQNLIYLQEIGSSQAQQPHTNTRKGLMSYLFFLVTKGSGTLEYQNTSYHLSQGSCVFIDCRKQYSHHSSENLWELKWIHFFGPNLEAIYEKYLESGGAPSFQAYNLDPFLQLWKQIFQFASSSAHIMDMEIYSSLVSLLSTLLNECGNINTISHSIHSDCNLLKIKEYLETHYSEKITLDSLSSKFFINKFYLTRIFKEKFGLSITSYLLQIRITHAKILLRFTDLSIEKISHECGMNDANYFSRVFKKIEGTTPGCFRKMW